MKASTLIRRCAVEGIQIELIAQAISSMQDDLPEGIRADTARSLGYKTTTTFHAAFDAAVALLQTKS